MRWRPVRRFWTGAGRRCVGRARRSFTRRAPRARVSCRATRGWRAPTPRRGPGALLRRVLRRAGGRGRAAAVGRGGGAPRRALRGAARGEETTRRRAGRDQGAFEAGGGRACARDERRRAARRRGRRALQLLCADDVGRGQALGGRGAARRRAVLHALRAQGDLMRPSANDSRSSSPPRTTRTRPRATSCAPPSSRPRR